jgi:hypothetical protein
MYRNDLAGYIGDELGPIPGGGLDEMGRAIV